MIFSGESITAHYFHGFTLHFRHFLVHCFHVSEPQNSYEQKQVPVAHIYSFK